METRLALIMCCCRNRSVQFLVPTLAILASPRARAQIGQQSVSTASPSCLSPAAWRWRQSVWLALRPGSGDGASASPHDYAFRPSPYAMPARRIARDHAAQPSQILARQISGAPGGLKVVAADGAV